MKWLIDLLRLLRGTGAVTAPDLVSLQRPQRPKRRGRSKEEIATDEARYKRELRANAIASFIDVRERALSTGSKFYIWQTSGDEDVCADCKKFSGRKFRWNADPPGGHPGSVHCPQGYCRCWAQAVLPR